MSFPAHVRSSLPKWRFWARMNRDLTDPTGAPLARLKKSWTQTASVMSLDNAPLIRAQLQIGVKADLYDAKNTLVGSVKLLRIQPRKLFTELRELWGIAKNGEPYMYLWPVEKHKVAHDVGSLSIAKADPWVYQVVKDDHVLGTLVPETNGLYENFDLVCVKGISEEDRLLAISLMAYRVHNLLK